MKIGILGYSQSGKKSLFTLLTGRTVPAGRKEQECVEGVALVRDPRVDTLSRIVQPQKTRYADTMAVLLPDLEQGSKDRHWLEAARRCELLCVVVRAFESESVYHPSGSVDAARDRSDLETELLLADLELAEKRLDRLRREKRAGQTPAQALEESVLEKCRECVEAGTPLRTLGLDEHQMKAIYSLGFLTMSPVLWTYNVDDRHITDNPWKDQKDTFVVSCLIEQEIASLQDENERREYMQSIGLTSSGLDRLNSAAYDMLGLMSFYTVGKDEVRAWTIRKGMRAPEAAGKIHSDIERGFIRADVIKFDDLVAAGGEEALRKAGKEQLRGKDYVIEDGDICHFRFSV